VHRFVAALAALATLALAPLALADGPGYISQGGAGVLAPDGKTRYVAVPAGNATAIERVRVHGGSVVSWTTLDGFWGIPSPTVFRAEGLTRDGRRLFVEYGASGSPSLFAVVDTLRWRVVDRFMLSGDFSYDALSPDASTLYLVQHVDTSNYNRYVVRAYDLRSHTLHPGRIADRTQRGWVMEGSAITRATSADGRWVYTLYQNPGGYPFIHALDTVSGVAHCTGLPWTGDQMPMWNVRLALRDGGKTLAVHWKSGKPWLTMDTASWRITHSHPTSFAWRWLLVGVVAVVVLSFAVLLRGRRRLPRRPAPVAL
jgi:hypothetical protein